MDISVKILFKALKTLPSYSKWEKDEWSFYYAFPDHEKDRRLVFRKNHESYSWDLILDNDG